MLAIARYGRNYYFLVLLALYEKDIWTTINTVANFAGSLLDKPPSLLKADIRSFADTASEFRFVDFCEFAGCDIAVPKADVCELLRFQKHYHLQVRQLLPWITNKLHKSESFLERVLCLSHRVNSNDICRGCPHLNTFRCFKGRVTRTRYNPEISRLSKLSPEKTADLIKAGKLPKSVSVLHLDTEMQLILAAMHVYLQQRYLGVGETELLGRLRIWVPEDNWTDFRLRSTVDKMEAIGIISRSHSRIYRSKLVYCIEENFRPLLNLLDREKIIDARKIEIRNTMILEQMSRLLKT